MGLAPLFVKYQTNSRNSYVYDPCTSEILRVGTVVHKILDDYRVLSTEELTEKHHALAEADVREALARLDALQSKGILRDHLPELTARPESVCCGDKPESLRDLLQNRRRLLTLEVTHRCNLACDYCAYGDHYHQSRRHSEMSMSLETAKAAVAQFMAHKPTKTAIGFYGGEPLLEFELIERIVLFAESIAERDGGEVRFALTTNGTLLNDEKLHFLAKHNFSVLISLDGNREAHDRYRVFKNPHHPGQRRGTFDVVINNMERFAELYPDYPGRGIALTLTATSDVDKIEAFIKHWKPYFPTVIPNYVSSVSRRSRAGNGGDFFVVGQVHQESCVGGSLGGEFSCNQIQCSGRETITDSHLRDDQPSGVPDFDDWTAESLDRIQASRAQFKSELSRVEDESGVTALHKRFPINEYLFNSLVRSFHKRRIVSERGEARRVSRLSCFPGATRTYCSAQGALFPCEKTEFRAFLRLGNVADDLDVDKAYDLTELLRLHSDCANCVARESCSHCPAILRESQERPGFPDAVAFQRMCQGQAIHGRLLRILREYTDVMESNPDVLDLAYSEERGGEDDWLNRVKVLVAKLESEELGIEELAESV